MVPGVLGSRVRVDNGILSQDLVGSWWLVLGSLVDPSDDNRGSMLRTIGDSWRAVRWFECIYVNVWAWIWMGADI